MTIEELREKFETMKAEPEQKPEETFELNGQLLEELRIGLEGAETVECFWGDMPRYCMIDFDCENKMVYGYDVSDHWRLYGFAFDMNGDNVEIDFESKKRMKFAIVEFDNGEQEMPFETIFEDISNKFTTNDTEWSEKYQSASNTIESQNEELGTLRQYKADIESAAAETARNEIFAQFEDLAGVEEFENLRNDCANVELATLEEKLYAIRGKNASVAKFSKEPRAPKLIVERSGPVNADEYGGLFSKYPPSRI